jgi:hypothetical protein
MYVRRTADPDTARVLVRRPLVLGAAALAALLCYASPAHSLASPACFKVCSKLYFKHISTLMKCAVKETVTPGTGVPCASSAATKMVANYDTKLQSKCGASPCAPSYPSANGAACMNLLFLAGPPNSAEFQFGFGASPPDPTTDAAIITVAPPGCAF